MGTEPIKGRTCSMVTPDSSAMACSTTRSGAYHSWPGVGEYRHDPDTENKGHYAHQQQNESSNGTAQSSTSAITA
jgi:hypothetical protein